MGKAKKQVAVVAKDPSKRTVKMANLIGPLFQKGLNAIMEASVDMKTSHQMLQIFEQVGKHHQQYETLRVGLVDRFGKKDEEGKLVMDAERKKYLIADQAAFDKHFAELLDLDVEISTISVASVREALIPPNALRLMLVTILTPES